MYPKPETGKRRIPYNDAVEEALCFGWIDGIIKKIDNCRTVQRFTPRRSAKSQLSELNKERVRRMIAAGRMKPAGMEKIRARMDEKFAPGKDVLAALKANRAAWKNFNAFPEWYQRIRVGWIENSRHTPDLFESRLRYLIKMSAQNRRFGMMKE